MMVKFNFSLKLWLSVFLLYSVGCITSDNSCPAGEWSYSGKSPCKKCTKSCDANLDQALNEKSGDRDRTKCTSTTDLVCKSQDEDRTCEYLLNPYREPNGTSSFCNWDDGCYIGNKVANNKRGKCEPDLDNKPFGKCLADEYLPLGAECESNYKNQMGTCIENNVCKPNGINDAKLYVTLPDIDPSAIDTPKKLSDFLQACNKMIKTFNTGQSADAKSDLICMDASEADKSDSRRRGLTKKGTKIQMQGAKKAPELKEFKNAVSVNNNKIGSYSAKGANTGSAPGTPSGSSGIQSNSIISAFVFTLAMM